LVRKIFDRVWGGFNENGAYTVLVYALTEDMALVDDTEMVVNKSTIQGQFR
jgi:hypothetical protein